jgi:hypothetical protein
MAVVTAAIVAKTEVAAANNTTKRIIELRPSKELGKAFEYSLTIFYYHAVRVRG